MSGDSWEVLLDRFWIAVFQSVVIIAEHLVVLEITSETACLTFYLTIMTYFGSVFLVKLSFHITLFL